MEKLKKAKNINSLRPRTDNAIQTAPPITNRWSEQIFDNLDVAEQTRKEYRYRIRFFAEFVRDTAFSRDSYLAYKRHLSKRSDLSVSSKNKYLIVAKVYCRELNRQGMLPVDISQGIRTFQQGRKHKKEGLTDSEVNAITGYINQLPQSSKNLRLKAILCLLTLQGLRQIEIVRLNVNEIDFVSQRAFVQGKGRDDKEAVDLHQQTCRVLKEYLQTNRISDGPVFVSTSNNSRNQRLTTKSIRNLINPILKELGIEKSLHGFRHFFVTKLVKAYQGDILQVVQYTRHKNLEMLQVYNDSVKMKADLPRFYQTFKGVNF